MQRTFASLLASIAVSAAIEVSGCCFGGGSLPEPTAPVVTAPVAPIAPPPPASEPGLEIGSVIFCDSGTHVRDGVVLTGGEPYALMARDGCNLTLRNCTLSSPGDQPTVQVRDGATVRLENCTVTSTHPERPAIWSVLNGHVVLVGTTLVSSYEASMSAGQDGLIEHFGTTMNHPEELIDNGRIVALTAAP